MAEGGGVEGGRERIFLCTLERSISEIGKRDEEWAKVGGFIAIRVIVMSGPCLGFCWGP